MRIACNKKTCREPRDKCARRGDCVGSNYQKAICTAKEQILAGRAWRYGSIHTVGRGAIPAFLGEVVSVRLILSDSRVKGLRPDPSDRERGGVEGGGRAC